MDQIMAAFDFDFKNVPGGWLGVLTACASVYASYRLYLYYNYNECDSDSYRLDETKRKIKGRQVDRMYKVLQLRERIEMLGIREMIDPGIIDLDFKDLQSKLQNGEVTAIDVLLAFIIKALEVNQKLNCVTEFLDDAMGRANKLDELDPDKRGPLHGIPISLKEGVGLANRDVTTGFAKSIDEPYEEDGILVQVLIRQGAVPFVRTNLSQGRMSLECSNPIFGVTRNPINPARTSGGSSGGEGALIGAGGSLLGLGCDMGGSIRVPAHFCGIPGFKCTPNRLSNAGNCPFGLNIIALADVYSPMGKNVDALVEFMKATLVPTLYELDPLLPRMPWNNELYESTEPLKIGFYTWDGGIEPVPAVKRAVLLAKATLEKLGHTVVEFQPPDVLYAFEHLMMSVICGDGGQHALEILKDDIVDPCIKDIIRSFERPMPGFVRWFMCRSPTMHPITKILINKHWPKNIAEWWDKNEEIEAYKRKFCSQMASQGITCLICPTLPFTAWPIENAQYNFESITYTSLYSVLGFPAGVVPTTTVTPTDTQQMDDYPTHTDVHKFVHEITKDSEGLPVGVQCVGLPFQEEVVFRLMKQLETSLAEAAAAAVEQVNDAVPENGTVPENSEVRENTAVSKNGTVSENGVASEKGVDSK